MEELRLKHNKAITVLLSMILFVFVGGLFASVVLIAVNFNIVTESVGYGLSIAAIILLSICIITIIILLINQVAKLGHDIIFIADEFGICDYSRHIVLKPIPYNEIKSIEYKEFFSDDASDFRHLRINLKNKNAYMRELNILQKVSFFLGLKQIELHLVCAEKINMKNIAEKLRHNLEVFNSVNGSESKSEIEENLGK